MMDFEVVSAATAAEALDALAQYGDEAKVIAGGQSLLNILKQGLMAPAVLVDIKRVSELEGLRVDRGLRIGAVTTHRALETSAEALRMHRVLCETERNLAYVQTRNWGTVGGTLCIADPTGDLAPVLIALDATVVLAGPSGERRVPLAEFFVGYYETVLGPTELLTWIEVPAPARNSGAAYEKFRNVEGDAPIVGAAVRIDLDEGGTKCSGARIVLGGAAPTPWRSAPAEKALQGVEPTAEAIAAAAEAAVSGISPIPDITASAEYKEKLVRVLVKRVAARALERARGAEAGGGGGK